MTNSPTCAVLFADICGSSSLYKALGNHAAELRIRRLLDSVSAIVSQHRGQVIKTIGDEIMARFDTADDALNCAVATQRMGGSLLLRMGLSYGEVVLKQGDAFGESVNDAAAVTKIARAEEIILTSALVRQLRGKGRHLCKEFDRIALKGGEQKCTIFRAHWQAEGSHSATQVMSLVSTTQQLNGQQLVLRLGNEELTISPEQTPWQLGRARQNHTIVESTFASREHCHILYRRGKYVLIDHSTNGTYVTPAGQREIYLRREELPLEGAGQFSLGCPADKSPITVHYNCTLCHS